MIFLIAILFFCIIIYNRNNIDLNLKSNKIPPKSKNMEQVKEKYIRFITLVNRIIINDKSIISQSSELSNFLKQPIQDFLATLKLALINKMSLLDIEDLIAEKLNIKKTEIPASDYLLLRRYLEYFSQIAQNL